MISWVNAFITRINTYLTRLNLPNVTLTLIDILEILILAWLVYRLLNWIQSSHAWTLLRGIMVIAIALSLIYLLQMDTLIYIINQGLIIAITTLVVIFQPHRYARLERYFDEFTVELKKADRVFVTPVFAAWTGSGKYTSDNLAASVGGVALAGSWDDMGARAGFELKAGDVAAIIGAGDLPKILPSLIAAAKAIS